ncbi:NACHT domain-containing protein, partial [Microbispora rosea]
TGGEVRDDLTDELMRLLAADHGRFVLVLGDFGRGKTFSLREVARRIPAELPHLTPILIELRALDKAHSVAGLVAAHLANHGEELIDLKAFNYMLRQGRIVLLFDGFDELVTRVTYERAADHLDTLLRAAEDKAKILVAGRTQHFKSRSQVMTALGEKVGLLPNRRVLSIEEFTEEQIRAYLVNRYGSRQAADERMALRRARPRDRARHRGGPRWRDRRGQRGARLSVHDHAAPGLTARRPTYAIRFAHRPRQGLTPARFPPSRPR